MQKLKIQVILGSIRENRAGEKVMRWFMDIAQNNPDAEFEFIDLRNFPLPLFADPVTPSSREGKHPNPEVQKWLDKITEADGYVIMTPEYNHSYPAVLKNALDYGYKEWNDKAVAFVGYGGSSGGIRAVEHLRHVIAELGMLGVLDQVSIPRARAAFAEDGTLKDGEIHQKNAGNLINSLVKLTRKLKA